MKRTTLLWLAVCLPAIGLAQNIKEATWIASVEQEVRTIHSTQLNVPLIETNSNNLFALEPSTGEILWKQALERPVKYINAIEGTP